MEIVKVERQNVLQLHRAIIGKRRNYEKLLIVPFSFWGTWNEFGRFCDWAKLAREHPRARSPASATKLGAEWTLRLGMRLRLGSFKKMRKLLTGVWSVWRTCTGKFVQGPAAPKTPTPAACKHMNEEQISPSYSLKHENRKRRQTDNQELTQSSGGGAAGRCDGGVGVLRARSDTPIALGSG
ncbi:hypothetical protein CSUI_007092, partial [Cystoisospora suis]